MQPYFPGTLISLSHTMMYNPEESKAGDYLSPVKCSGKVRFNMKLRGDEMTQKISKSRAQPCWEGRGLLIPVEQPAQTHHSSQHRLFSGACSWIWDLAPLSWKIHFWIISFCMALWWQPRLCTEPRTLSTQQLLESPQRNWIVPGFYNGKYIFLNPTFPMAGELLCVGHTALQLFILILVVSLSIAELLQNQHLNGNKCTMLQLPASRGIQCSPSHVLNTTGCFTTSVSKSGFSMHIFSS